LALHLAQGEQQDAVRLMHTLKGLSATVGAVQLADFAAKKEIELKTRMPEPQSIEALVQQTRSGIEAVMAEVSSLSDSIKALVE
jgi:HPt (histidine-containing phosphotransfer) domain-containing protein